MILSMVLFVSHTWISVSSIYWNDESTPRHGGHCGEEFYSLSLCSADTMTEETRLLQARNMCHIKSQSRWNHHLHTHIPHTHIPVLLSEAFYGTHMTRNVHVNFSLIFQTYGWIKVPMFFTVIRFYSANAECCCLFWSLFCFLELVVPEGPSCCLRMFSTEHITSFERTQWILLEKGSRRPPEKLLFFRRWCCRLILSMVSGWTEHMLPSNIMSVCKFKWSPHSNRSSSGSPISEHPREHTVQTVLSHKSQVPNVSWKDFVQSL